MIQFELSLAELQALLPESQPQGVEQVKVTGLASLQDAGVADLSFLGNRRYARQVPECQAGIVLVPADYEGAPREGQAFLRVPHPSLALATICDHIERLARPRPPAGIHPSAVVAEDAEVDPTAFIGPLCVVEPQAVIGAGVILRAQVFIGARAKVGADSELKAHVSIYHDCEVGRRNLLHSGAVIGADGFGFEASPKGPVKIPQIGRVVLGDDVEVGANSTIDRARFGATRVGRGTKIDNLVQVGHNCEIGDYCFLCAGVGVSGSTKIGNMVTLAGQVGVAGHLEIGDNVQVGGQAGVSKSLPGSKVYTGTPARDLKEQRRLDALTGRLPELFARVRTLEGNGGAEE
ncbi:MAG: UDP-3-O-(3-hydroxymyristoyl)glucosamine N-acyltransferase [Verrucomicrobiota bacterium JB022]|nr:UDP-3-O-(3-hydroxymyristoyl)glucosamine N-acyltransferase [Verrucomicrobiota bacterium JB022]